MAGLCWMAVMAALLMSAGNSLGGANQNQLEAIVTEILNRYRPTYQVQGGPRRYPMFSLAVSIPYNNDKYDISKVPDTGEKVREVILQCDVYTSTRVVAATVLRWPNVLSQCPNGCVQWPNVLRQCNIPKQYRGRVVTWADVQRWCPEAVRDGTADHTEYRTLQDFNTLLKDHNRDDLLLFYVLASPCDQRCTSLTHHWSILQNINLILNWKNYAIVFSDIFQPRDGTVIPEDDRRRALERLGRYKGPLGSIGLKNIFRCNHQSAGSRQVQCTSCSTHGQVTGYCFSDDRPLAPSYNLPSTSLIHSKQGRSNPPSQSGPSVQTSPKVEWNIGGGWGGEDKQSCARGNEKKNANGDREVSNTDVDSNRGSGQSWHWQRQSKKSRWMQSRDENAELE